MKVVKCENGHFFDLQKDSVCPRCGTDVYVTVGGAPTTDSKQDKKALKEQKKREKKQAKLEKKQKIQLPPPIVEAKKEEYINNAGHTEMLDKSSTVGSTMKLGAEERKPVIDQGGFVSTDLLSEKEVSISGVEDNKPAPIIDDEKTVYLDEMVEDCSASIDPVVGWLVCTEGSNIGKSYELKAGVNNIGRAVDMDVSIQGDNTVSRDKHAILIYDPNSREYLINAGPGRNLTYLNGNLVLSSNKLKNRDCIKLGKTKLTFVSLCTDSFEWK